MSAKYLAVVFLISIFLLGCADVYTVKPNLLYNATILQRPARGIVISLGEFKDVRPNKGSGTIGTVSLGADHYDGIMEPSNIPQWVTNAFEYELTRAGYKVSKKGGVAQVEGEINDIKMSKLTGYDATIVLSILVKQGNDVFLDKKYTGQAHKYYMYASTLRRGSEEALMESLQQAIKQAIDDIDELKL